MLTTICTLLALASPQEPTAGPPSAAVAWIQSHAIPLVTPVAGHGFDDLTPLARVVGDARIVALGESTHGTRETFQCKHRLLEYLVERAGFSIFSIEANLPEAYALNDYVIHGQGDPRQLIAGMYFWTWNTEEVLAMVEWMRAWNIAHQDRTPLQFTGFDMQTPTVAARIARAFVAAHAKDLDGDAKVLELATQLQRGGEAAFASATGSFPVEAARGKKLVFAGWIRTEDADGAAGLWWRCDTATGMGAFDNMTSQRIRGTRHWRRFELRLDIGADTQSIHFGCLLSGGGAAWFDDLEVTLDGEPFVHPAFGFDFEGQGADFLAMHSHGGYTIRLVDSGARGGRRCLEVRKTADGTTVPDAKETAADLGRLVAALEHRRSTLAAATSATSAKAVDWAVQNARVVHQCARLMASDDHRVNVRDQCMAENVAWILAQNPGQKIVLWAHNQHVGRGERWGMRWMGHYLEQAFPGQMVVFGFATGRGTYTAMDRARGALRSDHVLQLPPADSVEALLASAGASFLLDVRHAQADHEGSAWATVERPMRSIGAMAMEQQFSPCTVKQAFDVLVWQATTNASVRLPR